MRKDIVQDSGLAEVSEHVEGESGVSEKRHWGLRKLRDGAEVGVLPETDVDDVELVMGEPSWLVSPSSMAFFLEELSVAALITDALVHLLSQGLSMTDNSSHLNVVSSSNSNCSSYYSPAPSTGA